MSLQLVLTHYLASLRERKELDALLPELLKAMGHSVLSRAQVGAGQAGVDIVSTYVGEGGKETVFLWILKFGDVGRTDLCTGNQAIVPSVREASTVFTQHRLPAPLRALPIRLIVVSNGVLLQTARDGFTAIVDETARATTCCVEFWGMDQLTPLIEQHLFDEGLLLDNGKADLRAALAGLEESETTVHRFVRFVDRCMTPAASEATLGAAARKRTFLRSCAAAAMGYGVLAVWGQAENNLKPGVVVGEYLMLRLWSDAVNARLHDDEDFLGQLSTVMSLHVEGLQEYFKKVAPALLSPRALVGYRSNHVFYAQLVFEEIGRLAALLLALQRLGAPADARHATHQALTQVINAHPACRRPVLDNHGIDLSLVLAALMGEGDAAGARALLRGVVHGLHRCFEHQSYLPVDTDLLEDAIATQVTGQADPRDFFQVSTVIPMLATVAALLGDEDTLAVVRALQPNLEGVTLERWWPNAALETFTGTHRSLAIVGVSRALARIRDTAHKEAEAALTLPAGAAASTDFRWHDSPCELLVAISARLHRHPLPTWFLAQCLQAPPEATDASRPDDERRDKANAPTTG